MTRDEVFSACADLLRGWCLELSDAERLQETITALYADAERYRWLRAYDNADLLAEDVIDDAIAVARSQP